MSDFDKYRDLANPQAKYQGMKTRVAVQRKAKLTIKMIYAYQKSLMNPHGDPELMAYCTVELTKLHAQLEMLNWVLGAHRIEP